MFLKKLLNRREYNRILLHDFRIIESRKYKISEGMIELKNGVPHGRFVQYDIFSSPTVPIRLFMFKGRIYGEIKEIKLK